MADPLQRGVHTWPTWDFVELTFRQRTGLEARPIAAGMPWLDITGRWHGYYRHLWFSDVVPPGTAPGDPRTVVGLTVAGIVRLIEESGAPHVEALANFYVYVIRTLAQNLRLASPDPQGVVDVSLDYEFVYGAFASTQVEVLTRLPGIDTRAWLSDLIRNEPPTTIQETTGRSRIISWLPLEGIADADTPVDYVERLSAVLSTRDSLPIPERRPQDLTDSLGRLALAYRSVTRNHLWEQYPIEYVGRLSSDPQSGDQYRNHIESLSTLLELMRVPRLPDVEPNAKALNRLRSWLTAYIDPDRANDVTEAVDTLKCIPALRNLWAHTNVAAARQAARRLGLPVVVDDYPAAYNTVATAVISAATTLADLIIEADLEGRSPPDHA